MAKKVPSWIKLAIAAVVVGGLIYFFTTGRGKKMLSRGKASKMAHGPAAPEISESAWKKKLKDGSKFVVAMTASWCSHCRKMKPSLAKAASQVPGVFNFDASNSNSDLLKKFNVRGFPSIMFFEGGSKVGEYKGDRSAADMTAKFKKFMS